MRTLGLCIVELFLRFGGQSTSDRGSWTLWEDSGLTKPHNGTAPKPLREEGLFLEPSHQGQLEPSTQSLECGAFLGSIF